jgi:hypothetical protein
MCSANHQAYCESRQEFIDIKQSLGECILEHQCFSDDPCPLYGKFQAETLSAAAVRIRSTEGSRNAMCAIAQRRVEDLAAG